MAKTIVLSGGGTAGHIYPALALAEKLIEQGFDVKFAGTPNGIESELVPAASIEFKGFKAAGFNRAKPWTLITSSLKIAESTREARKWFSEIEPVCVVGFGGYVSIPVTHAAEQLGIPVIVHEQNSVMGMANHYIAKKASAVCLTYPVSMPNLDTSSWEVIGNPVRSEVIAATKEQGRKYLGVPEDAILLTVFGGSLGAQHINEAIARIKNDLLNVPNLYIAHMPGKKDFERTSEQLALTQEESKRWILKPYEENMALVLAAADACVSRAGATSLAEIAARKLPAVLVPYPFARGDHQTLNATHPANSGCAILIPDAKLDVSEDGIDKFKDSVMSLVQDESMREKMREAAESVDGSPAAQKLAAIVISTIGSCCKIRG